MKKVKLVSRVWSVDKGKERKGRGQNTQSCWDGKHGGNIVEGL